MVSKKHINWTYWDTPTLEAVWIHTFPLFSAKVRAYVVVTLWNYLEEVFMSDV